ncbi:hypothetical protein DCCM_2515 [Desulfocucumis palustris]|uniref:Uncharacterized protein n=1 Tax=Desulfocucumis palustris TaxID=1898651 RepID=A0A2L2XBQ4_9FIRM|nr:hypothetical protein DCCM_2515 [Desulfocucumis palustris]
MNATVSIILSFPVDIVLHYPYSLNKTAPATKPYIPYYGRKRKTVTKIRKNLG